MPKTTIPEIDVSPLFGVDYDAGLELVAAELAKVYTTVGFAFVKGHQISQNLIDNAFAIAKQFFHQPMAEKRKFDIGELEQGEGGRGRSGYMSASDNVFTNSGLGVTTSKNDYENYRLQCLVQDRISAFDEQTFLDSNLWPDALKNNFELLKQLITQQLQFFEKITQAFSIAFGFEKTDLDPIFQHVDLGFKLHHCPKRPNTLKEDEHTILPHIDYGFLTLLATDTNPGLQVMDGDEQWIDVPYQSGSLILNTGESMQRLTNDKYIATKHRVVTPPDCERYSMPLFLNPHGDALLKPFENFIASGDTAHYPSETYTEMLKRYL